ncbi:tumor necrosis factor receptor superfamily member 8 isoform X1 [Pelobates cultripes]|uniref:Tumor necrosis factor receptor superfamily member 8 isoform X1 n=1 Tax=Pelobates cultripes TaxID=61616 RepID=A0AAD1R9C1_PELCU|nr:tumor necrosis factor receptor superfamily member 8 isoform X1 [Pelobates cultripes]
MCSGSMHVVHDANDPNIRPDNVGMCSGSMRIVHDANYPNIRPDNVGMCSGSMRVVHDANFPISDLTMLACALGQCALSMMLIIPISDLTMLACALGFEKRHLCIKDPSKDCKQPCPKGYYINWEDRPARCCYCANCKQDPDLIEVQPCSASSNAICHCRPGFYCKTPLENTCARCVSHQKCTPGFRVKKAGNAFNDTVCEECPLGSHSNGSEGCKSHTTRLLKPTMQNFVRNKTSKRTPDLYLTAHKPLTTRHQHVTVSHSMATTGSDSVSLVPTVMADTGM